MFSRREPHRQHLVVIEEYTAGAWLIVPDCGENAASAHVCSEGLKCQRVPGPAVRIHGTVFTKLGTHGQPVPEMLCRASWCTNPGRFGPESSICVESLEGLQGRESNLLQMFSGRMVRAVGAEACDQGMFSSGPFYECLVQCSSDAETAVLFVDSDAFEPCNVWGLEASVGNANRPSVYGCNYESRVLVGEPVVPDLREIVMAAPDLLRDL